DFMRLHPGGDRILQLYAGRDATRGFERAHRGRASVAQRLERYRIGAVRPIACLNDPEHAMHHLAARALGAALALVVEMQSALSVDHSFQLEALDVALQPPSAARSSRYELQRGLETHARFHREYLDVMIDDTLADLAGALLAREIAAELLARLKRSPECIAARAWALELRERHERFTEQELTVAVACFEVLDGWLLRTWKRDLSRALHVFERAHVAALPLHEGPRLSNLCERLLEHVSEYFRSAGRASR
ncbi:MAG TPA: cytochrome b5-like heme/steroid binding domain-containing protein, partial [Polyangiales bacterium]